MDYFTFSSSPGLVAPILAVTLAFSLFFYSKLWKRSRNEAPAAGGSWPIIGHLPVLSSSLEPTHLLLGKWADKYGPIFSIKLGVNKTLIISSFEMAKECLKTNDKVFANRPKCIAAEVLGYNYALFPYSSYGDYFCQIRKIATLEVLSPRRIEMLKHLRESEVKASIKELYDAWMKNNEAVVEMKEWFSATSENLIFRLIVGKRVTDARESKVSEGCNLGRDTFREFLRLGGVFMLADAIPLLRWLDLGGHERAMKNISKELDLVFTGWLEEHKQKRKISAKLRGTDEEHDFMDALLSILDGQTGREVITTSNYDADTINKATSQTLLLAGAETTSATLTWTLALLVNSPEALKKAQDEIDQIVGRDRQVQESDTDKLVYLHAIIKETMRLYPAGPLALPHMAGEDCIVGDYHVPRGTRLLVNIAKIQRDPKVWPNPHEFLPERFLTTHKGVDFRGQDFSFIPFGSGRRMCPGISLALKVSQFTLASLLHGFEIKTPGNKPVPMRETVSLTNHFGSPLELHLTPRLPAHLYE